MATKPRFLLGKRVLLISPSFFGYEKQIAEAIIGAGGECVHIDERPGNDALTKAFVRLNAAILKHKIRRYYDEKLAECRSGEVFDYVVVVSPEAFTTEILGKFREAFPNARFVLYMWDSIRNKTGSQTGLLIPMFDRTLSFDQEDCMEYPNLIFRPLFYSKAFAEISKRKEQSEYDLSFVGTAHSDRYDLCRRIAVDSEEKSKSVFTYLYISDKRLFWFQKAFSKAMRNASIKEFAFTPMPYATVMDVFAKSRAVLDIQHPLQIGLTMRSIEVLGAKRKLVTTNRSIVTYDFYREANVCIVDRENPKIPVEFYQTSYQELEASLYQKYSIDGWLQEVLGV